MAGHLARVHFAPTWGSERQSLQAIASTLYSANVQWIRDALRRGLVPPLRALSCEPPWCERGVFYVRYHGDAPVGVERDYFDGPMMFHRGRGTCIDVASYDAAASTVIENRPATPEVVGELPHFHCIVRFADGSTFDPTAEALPWR